MYIVYEYVIHILMVNTFLGSPQAQRRCSYTGCADEEMAAQSGGATTPPRIRRLPQVYLMEMETHPRIDSLASSPLCCKDRENRTA